MITLEKITATFIEMGYQKMDTEYCSSRMLWKGENDLQKIIYLVNNDYMQFINRQSIVYTSNKIRTESFVSNQKNVEILYVVITDSSNHKKPLFAGENVLFFNMNNGRLCTGKVSSCFQEEKEAFLHDVDMEKLHTNWNKSAYGCYDRTYTAWLTYVLIALTIVIEIKTYTGNASDIFGISPAYVFGYGQYYRLITYQFIHAGAGHLFSNMLTLYFCGKIYERANGSIRLLTIYLLGGIYGGLVSIYQSVYVTGDYTQITVGASGAIFAILGAIAADLIVNKNRNSKVVIGVIIMIGLNIGYGMLNASVNNACHIGGLLAGICLMICFKLADQIKSNKNYVKCVEKKLKNGETVHGIRRW